MNGDIDLASDGWLKAARYSLVFTGVCYLLLVPLGPFIAMSEFHEAHAPRGFNLGFTIGFTLMLLVVGGGLAAANFVAARGIKNGKRWAWLTGVILGALYAPSICLPFGVVILYGLLREPVRNFYLGTPPAAVR